MTNKRYQGFLPDSEIADVVKRAEDTELDLDDARLGDVVALIDACRHEPDLRARYRNAAARSEVLAGLGISRRAPDRDRAVDDVAAVLAAYSYARENAHWRLKHVRDTLEAVLKHATGITTMLGLSRPADVPGIRARMMIEDAAFRSVLKAALPHERARSRFQATSKQRTLAALTVGSGIRRGAETARRAARAPAGRAPLAATVEGARRSGLSPEHEALATKCAEDTAHQLWGGIELLTGAAKALLKTFPQPVAKFVDEADQKAALLAVSGRMSALQIMPPPGMVLAWGGLELLVAWAPEITPSMSGAKKTGKDGRGNLSNLVADLHNAVASDAQDRELRSQLRLAVAAWKAGRHAVLFDGRTGLAHEQRILRLRTRELDQYLGDTEALPRGTGQRRRSRA